VNCCRARGTIARACGPPRLETCRRILPRIRHRWPRACMNRPRALGPSPVFLDSINKHQQPAREIARAAWGDRFGSGTSLAQRPERSLTRPVVRQGSRGRNNRSFGPASDKAKHASKKNRRGRLARVEHRAAHISCAPPTWPPRRTGSEQPVPRLCRTESRPREEAQPGGKKAAFSGAAQ